jgi:hypothetical protein
MYAEDSTNNAKKRMLKGWAVQFADDKTISKTSTASTVPQSKAFDTLLDITEEIETQSEILVSDLDKATIETGQARFDTRSNEVVSRLYRDVRKGISALTKTNFKDLPRSDIGKLESYSNSLSGYYDRLNTINVETKNLNQPAGDPQGQVEGINRYIDEKNAEADEKKRVLGLTKREKININAREKRESDRLAKAIKDINIEKSKLEKELPKIDKTLVKLRAEKAQIQADYHDDDTAPQNDAIEARDTELDELILALEEDKVDIPERLNEIKVELTNLNRERRDLTNETKRQTDLIDKEIDDRVVEANQIKDDITLATRDLKAVEPLAVIEKGKAIKTQSSAVDFKLILQNYKVFLDTLTDGLRLYNSGLSGKVNKVGETVGSGRMVGGSYIIGGAEYQHRRFM